MTKKSGLSVKHILDIESLSPADISAIFDKAEFYAKLNQKQDKKHPVLKGRTLINLFFENSTRTRTSFELAGKRLGADVINIQVSTSSLSKGETLVDTAMTINAMHPDFVAVRHNESGAVKLLSEKIEGSVINGGDGCHEHPTQALLDVLTIQRKVGKIKGLTVAICGDILHSRVARSNITLLNKLGAKVRLIGPKTLIPRFPEVLGKAEIFHTMEEGLKNVDVVMMLRLQKERMSGCYIASEAEYFVCYGLDYDKLQHAKKSVFVMHPGPINRGLEIDSELADDINRSVILDQVEMGVAVRQAILELLA